MLLGISAWQTVLGLAAVIAIILSFLFFAQLVYFVNLCRWADQNTKGVGYYGRTLENRRRFKRTLAFRASFAMPLLWLLSRLSQVKLENASFNFEGVFGPKDSCSENSFQVASEYEPDEEDVFVVTQMRCGTTWMQHLVFQILTRGTGDLVETGQSLYSVSPWLEGTRSVSVQAAPLIGSNQTRRIIKTHLPTTLCPFREQARYIYVARHPISCFASTVDFIRMHLGPFDIPLESFEKWFCSSQMWWSPWPEHVRGWSRRSQENSNVLLLRFEDMKNDLPGTSARVAEFLNVLDLSNSELELIVRKCSFAYMSQHSEVFEMSVPTVLQSSLAPFVSGRLDRQLSVPDATRDRILRWCRESLNGSGLSWEDLYADLG